MPGTSSGNRTPPIEINRIEHFLIFHYKAVTEARKLPAEPCPSMGRQSRLVPTKCFSRLA